MNVKFHATRQRARAGNSTICYRKKQNDVSFQCVCPVIDHEFLNNIVKVACRSTRLSPRGSTAGLKLSFRNFSFSSFPWRSRVGAVMRALAFHHSGLGSIPGLHAICGLSLWVLYSSPRRFSPLNYSGFPFSSKTNI